MSPYIEYESPAACYNLYESPMSNGKKVMCRVNVFSNVGQMSRSRSHDQNLWYHQKGLVIRNTHVKYESSMSNG